MWNPLSASVYKTNNPGELSGDDRILEGFGVGEGSLSFEVDY